jgi:hypothetical protein
MKIHCIASIPVDIDEPAPCIRQFVLALRHSAVDFEEAAIDLNLVGLSVRARTTRQEFQPTRVKDVAFPQALDVVEELTSLSPAKIKSLHFNLSARGFRWKGSAPLSSARFALLDAKSLQRKQRFQLSAHLYFEAVHSAESSVDTMLADVEAATGIRFDRDASSVRMGSNEPGRATQEELFVTDLAWRDLVETVGQQIRASISLDRIPHLRTAYQALQMNFIPGTTGKADRLNFARIARGWLKREFSQFSASHSSDGVTFEKTLADDLRLTLQVYKRAKPYSRNFTVALGIALASPRFAPEPDRPMHLAVNVFELFGIGPLPMQWTYTTEAELLEALQACADLVNQILTTFEPAVLAMRKAYQRRVEEFAGPRHWSAREAYDATLPLVRTWAVDAALIRLGSTSISGRGLAGFDFPLPPLHAEGRLALSGGWRMIFHSPEKQENLHVELPCRGLIRQLRLDAPHGRQWPSDEDQIIAAGWLDSIDVLRIARATVETAVHLRLAADASQFELISRANVLAGKPLRLPLRDGMFAMEHVWRVSFDHQGETRRTTAIVTVPAFGKGAPIIEIRAYDPLGP